MKKNRKVTKKMVKEIINQIDDFYGIKLTESQVLYLLINNFALTDAWDVAGEVDTIFREKFLSFIIWHCGIKDRDWPTGRSSPKYSREFYEEFVIKAAKKGIKFIGL